MTEINTPRLAMFTVDCADPTESGRFYADLLGWTVTYSDDNAVMISGGDGPALGFGRVDDFHPPAWPDPEGRKQFHLDLSVPDIPAAEAAAVKLGAAVPARWRPVAGAAGPGRTPVLSGELGQVMPRSARSGDRADIGVHCEMKCRIS